MLGLQDFGVASAYMLTILSAIGCVVYGVVNWNRPKEDESEELREEAAWEKNDPELNEEGAK